jgi:GTP-binding protein
VANKVDDPSWEAHGLESAALGFGSPVLVSATSGYGTRQLREAVWERIGGLRAEEPPAGPEARFAIVGRRNAGKSSLVNALAGEPRVIVSEIAGTTRDAIDVRFEIDGKVLVAIDTAGVRKRKSWADDVEYYSFSRTEDAIGRADVCVLLLDATEKCSQVEKRLAMQLEERFKPTVIAVNKWDLVSSKLSPDDYIEYLTQEFPGLDFAPIVFISAKDGTGLRELLALVANLDRQSRHREGTGRVNHAVRTILEQRGPSSRLGTRAKVFYVAQIDVKPPTIAMVVNKPDLFEGSYERFFKNQLREHLPFSEVPIKLVFSERKREER